jgi:type I restriction enzyme S subunit
MIRKVVNSEDTMNGKEVIRPEINGLPASWEWSTIRELIGPKGIFIDGDWVESKDQDPNGDIRLIQLADIGDGFYKNKSDRYLSKRKAVELGCTFLKEGDVLIARMPDPLGRACIFPGDNKKSVTVVDVCIVRTGEKGANHRWLMYAVNSLKFRTVVEGLQSGSTRKRISRNNLAKIELPVPPLPEQERIVARIEELFTQLEAGTAALERIRAGLRRYKASVLKAACEGRLISGNGNVLPIREGELPEGWRWVTVEQLAKREKGSIKRGPFGSTVKKAFFVPKGFKIYEQQNVIQNDFTLGSYYIDRQRFELLKGFQIFPGDLLITGAGTIGKLAIVPLGIKPGIINQALLKISLDPNLIDTQFFIIWFETRLYDYLIAQSRGSAMKNISSVRDLKIMEFALPPMKVQRRIVAEVERRLSVAEEAESTVEMGLKRAARLRQSILKAAFEGKLV